MSSLTVVVVRCCVGWRPMRRSARFTTLLFVTMFGSGAQLCHAGVQARKVTSAVVGKDGLVHIRRGDGTEFVAPRETSPVRLADTDDMQVSVEAPVIAKDGRTVGWLANFPNCCTSYPIPLVIVIYRDGGILRRIRPSVELPIWKWIFADAGSRVAYYSETVHSGMGRRSELREVASGKLLDEWYPGKNKTLPKWAERFVQDLAPLKEGAPN